jgi:hypothetical protein
MLSLARENGLTVLLDPIETGGWIHTLEANAAVKAFNYGGFHGPFTARWMDPTSNTNFTDSGP